MFATRKSLCQMRVFQKADSLNKFLEDFRENESTIGLVPTMGALHDGHLSLVRKSLAENDVVEFLPNGTNSPTQLQ